MLTELEIAVSTLDNLSQYISLIESTDALIGYNPVVTDSASLIVLNKNVRTVLKSFTKKRVFEYNSVIVSIYGALENFIEGAIISYINWLNRLIPSYEKLPTVILGNHYELSAKLINNLSKAKYNKLTTKEEIIVNLHSCIINSSYKLNYYAYIDHSANFRHNEVETILRQAGVDELTQKLLHCKQFRDFLSDLHQVENVMTLDELAFEPLKNLAQRRNDVAHGVDGEILSPGLLLELINYVKNYIQSIYYIMRQELFSLAIDYSVLRCETLRWAFKNGTIACFDLPAGTLAINDPLIYTVSDDSNEYKISNVSDLHVNKVQQTSFTWTSETTICIELSAGSKVNRNSKIYFINPQVEALLSQI